jgi:pimeloyl-ACP methyl ester carboxylesterase
MQAGGKTIVITVHGTNDGAEGTPPDLKWWQPESAFSRAVRARLAQAGQSAEIVAHKWTGANSAMAREQAAERLAKLIRKHRGKHVHVVAHSHGGNVAAHAAELVGWGRRDSSLATLTTVGTPFFESRFGRAEYIGALSFLALTLVSALTMAGAIALALMQPDSDARLGPIAVLAALSALSFAFVLPLALQGWRRVSRTRRRFRTVELHAIWHPNDEAISFLQSVEKARIEPFPKGALFRGSRTAAILLSVRIILFLVLALLIVGLGSLAINHALNQQWLPDDHFLARLNIGVSGARQMIWTTIAASLVLFSFLYVLARLLFGGLPELLARGRLNAWVAGAVRGMAFGRDSDQPLGNVRCTAHAFTTREIKLDGEVAARLKDGASQAAARLLEKYRWRLFNIGGDQAEVLREMTEDAMTWDGLVHTTYFDHTEVADVVADIVGGKPDIGVVATNTQNA